MAGLNICQFIGRLTDDPKFFEGKTKSAHRAVFTLACEAKWRDVDGHLTSKVEFVDMLAWGNMAIVMRKFTHKGYRLYVLGRLETSRWLGEDGMKRKRTEIILRRMLILQHRRKDDPEPPVEAEGLEDDDQEG